MLYKQHHINSQQSGLINGDSYQLPVHYILICHFFHFVNRCCSPVNHSYHQISVMTFQCLQLVLQRFNIEKMLLIWQLGYSFFKVSQQQIETLWSGEDQLHRYQVAPPLDPAFLCLHPSYRWAREFLSCLSVHVCMPRQRHSQTVLLNTSSYYYTVCKL